MDVVKLCMWPKGSRQGERVLAIGTLACISQNQAGQRTYRVRLYKDTAFGGPDGSGDLHDGQIWREGIVGGHVPGRRGGWDLLGGALRLMLGPRLNPYRRIPFSTEGSR